MNLDARIETKSRPMYGCHSDLDMYKRGEIPSCGFMHRPTEKACEGCSRRIVYGSSGDIVSAPGLDEYKTHGE